MTRKQRFENLFGMLPVLYPDARCLLDYDGSPFRLLISTILAAQTTDRKVNEVTPKLWSRYGSPAELADAPSDELERIVHPLGFFRNKARAVARAAERVAVDFGGRVPPSMSGLLSIPGVGRKTANVVLGEAFGKPALIVDTHVRRLSLRLDLTRKKNPDLVERDLAEHVPPARRTSFSHQLGFHGRQVCHARKPACASCVFDDFCPHRGVGRKGK
ncbi:endonuclease III [Candidatus Fermentibacteria bacterium]|nr:endonuclease III [Candidatus Fermentibacteria bacterium]